MAYPLNESFAAGIPAGFADIGGGGGVTVTHNATAEAVDLAFNTSQSFWRMLTAEFSTDFWFEMDVELVSKTISAWHFGFWLYSSGTYGGHRHAYNLSGPTHSWQRSSWTESGSEYSSAHGVDFAEYWLAAGARKTIRIDVRKNTNGTNPAWLVLVSVNGVPVMIDVRRDFTLLRPAIFGYGCTLRIHSVRGDLASSLAAWDLAVRAAPQQDVVMRPRPSERLGLAAVRQMARRNGHNPEGIYSGGRIAGTVKEKGAPNDVPVVRRLVLLDEHKQRIERVTWSDVQGNYAFEQVDFGRRYAVVGYDHTGAYRAVIADSLQATLP